MTRDVRKYVTTCDICQKVKPSNQREAGKMGSNRAYLPNEIVSMDIIGKLPQQPNSIITF